MTSRAHERVSSLAVSANIPDRQRFAREYAVLEGVLMLPVEGAVERCKSCLLLVILFIRLKLVHTRTLYKAVVMEGTTSNWLPISRSIVQGSGLGSMLFVVYAWILSLYHTLAR